MRVKVIGSGSMWNEYNSACYLIDNDIMIDFPNGACKYLYRSGIKPSDINYLIITHFHGDHYFDVPFYLLNKGKSNNKISNIYCDVEGYNKIEKLGELAFGSSYKYAKNELKLNFNYDNEFKIRNYNVEKVLVDHGNFKPAHGYIISYDDKKIGFTGDTFLCKNVELMADKCNYLFCDCMLKEGNDRHQGIDNIEYLSNKYPNCKYIVSHLNNDTRIILKEKNIKNVIVPEDGLEIEI